MKQTVTVSALTLCVNMAARPKRFVHDFHEMGPAVGKVEKGPKINKNLYKQNFISTKIYSKHNKNSPSGIQRGIWWVAWLWLSEALLSFYSMHLWRTRNIFLTVICIMLSSESCGLVGGMTLKYKWMSMHIYFHQDLVKSPWAQRGKDVYSVTDNRLLDGRQNFSVSKILVIDCPKI